MAKAKKYELSFLSNDAVTCRVDFLFEGYVGAVINLIGGVRPFVLKEFNTNDDLFKSIRPLLAEIQIVTNSSGVTADSFLADQDTDIEINFYCNNLFTPYWSGFVLQDDFQESYEDTNHILTITASEALGSLKDKALTNGGVEITTMVTPLQLIEYCLANTSKPLTNYFVFNNLYHTSMSTTLPDTALSLAKIDPRTFEISPREYEDSYTVLSKINTAFNQTIFQYENKWFIYRIEDLYTSANIRGYQNLGGTVTTLNKRYDIEVGKAREIKPVAPQMIRFINRKPKETIIKFNFERLEEVLKNSSFSRGNLLYTYPTFKDYSINDWTFVKGNYYSKSTATTGSALRREIFSSNTGPIIDNYIVISQTTDTINYPDQMIESSPLVINFGEVIKLNVETQYSAPFTPSSLPSDDKTIYVYLVGNSGNKYLLNESGQWVLDNVNNPNNPLNWIKIPYSTAENIAPEDWNTIEVESLPAPDNGFLYVYLICIGSPNVNGLLRYFKNFEFEILNRLDGFQIGLTAVESKFQKSADIKFNNEYDLYLNDFISESYKGLIYQNDGVTPTDFEWFRYRYSGERNSFKKQNAIAYWSHNRYDRDKIDATFYGLKWDDSGTTRIIGLPNTIKLLDDSPNKIFYISNLKEIDFSSATWSVTMEEVWDTSRDGAAAISRTLDLNVNIGTYNNQSSVPFVASTNPDFVVTGDNKIVYVGAEPITETITISLSGDIETTTGAYPVNTTFLVKQNTTTIKTQTYPVNTNPQSFSFNLSPAGTITINPNDEFQITYSAEVGKSITSIEFTAGYFQVSSYDVPNTLNYDTYIEKYIYK